ncbi:MAG TPA: response regulator [Candidatus Saccharimonadales bacterium]|nr:response regulator [Candidatus Saccharimonadales bacterium]
MAVVNKTILIVEDDESLVDLYSLEFQDEGYRVLAATSGERALARVQEDAVDLVVLDLKMEGMDGLTTLGELLRVRRDLPVVINSAYPAFKHDFGAWGAEAYVVKSANLDELKCRVREALQRREQVQAA